MKEKDTLVVLLWFGFYCEYDVSLSLTYIVSSLVRFVVAAKLSLRLLLSDSQLYEKMRWTLLYLCASLKCIASQPFSRVRRLVDQVEAVTSPL